MGVLGLPFLWWCRSWASTWILNLLIFSLQDEERILDMYICRLSCGGGELHKIKINFTNRLMYCCFGSLLSSVPVPQTNEPEEDCPSSSFRRSVCPLPATLPPINNVSRDTLRYWCQQRSWVPTARWVHWWGSLVLGTSVGALPACNFYEKWSC